MCMISRPKDDERTPLLTSPVASSEAQDQSDEVPASLANHIYVSHFLSTWNSRVFEFGAVLYLATIFPGTLLPMSIYALARGFFAIFFAPAVGQYIDNADRLQVVRLSIGEHY
jgi:iron-regulated transporter 1